MKERRIFFLNHLKRHKDNASITPSSRYLARQMVKNIDFSEIKNIIEIGPGTGVFTKLLIERAEKGTKIICIELEKSYVKMLKEKFTDKITVEHADVRDIDKIRQKYHIDKIDLIISGLPFEAANLIKKEIKKYTQSGTIFRSFTYQPRIFEKHYQGYPIRRIGFTLLNIPPSWVYGIN